MNTIELNKQISEIINDLKEIKNDCIKMDKFLPAELQNKVEENSIIIMGKIILKAEYLKKEQLQENKIKYNCLKNQKNCNLCFRVCKT